MMGHGGRVLLGAVEIEPCPRQGLPRGNAKYCGPAVVVADDIDHGDRGMGPLVGRVQLDRFLEIGNSLGEVLGCVTPIVFPAAQERVIGPRVCWFPE